MQNNNNAKMANDLFMPRNRAERRALAKKLKVNQKVMKEMLKTTIENIAIDYLPTGQKVRLKAEQILAHKNDYSKEYIEFVEKHKDDILTVERDPNKEEDARVVTLQEQNDVSIEARFLFDYADLEIVLDEDEVK